MVIVFPADAAKVGPQHHPPDQHDYGSTDERDHRCHCFEHGSTMQHESSADMGGARQAGANRESPGPVFGNDA
jgi:hypothetical protein